MRLRVMISSSKNLLLAPLSGVKEVVCIFPLLLLD